MAENSKIPWCDHTFNPWVGCEKVSPACDNCYAESWAKRSGSPGLWVGDEPRRTSEANWNMPLKWNRMAEAAGTRQRVFCASLADVFDARVPRQWREDLWTLIIKTPMLDWLILTKRPENFSEMLPFHWYYTAPLTNVWLGVTVENREQAARRIPILQSTPAAIRFLSCEPLLEDIAPLSLDGIDWVICGGESGGNARLMRGEWATRLLDECRRARVPFFMKQMGAVSDRIAKGAGVEFDDVWGWGYMPLKLWEREFPRDKEAHS